jgi:hypothetical protein
MLSLSNWRSTRWLYFVCACGLLASGCAALGQETNVLEVHGFVVDAETKKPLQGVEVSVEFRERLTWWERRTLTPEGWRKPRYGASGVNKTDAAGAFAIDIRSAMDRIKESGQQTWPQEIWQVSYFFCGYEPVYQGVEGDIPLKESELLLVLGTTQRVEMHRPKPSSRYFSKKC